MKKTFSGQLVPAQSFRCRIIQKTIGWVLKGKPDFVPTLLDKWAIVTLIAFAKVCRSQWWFHFSRRTRQKQSSSCIPGSIDSTSIQKHVPKGRVWKCLYLPTDINNVHNIQTTQTSISHCLSKMACFWLIWNTRAGLYFIRSNAFSLS